MAGYNQAFTWEEGTYPMTIYGHSPGTGSLADWMPSPVPVS